MMLLVGVALCLVLLVSVHSRLGNVAEVVAGILRREEDDMTVIEELVAEVRRNREVDVAARAAIVGLLQQIADAADTGDMDLVKAAVADLRASTDELAAAIPAQPEEPAAEPTAENADPTPDEPTS